MWEDLRDSDEKYLALFSVIDVAVKKYLMHIKHIKKIKLKSKDKHSILYNVEWDFKPSNNDSFSHYFAVSSTGRTLYMELNVPGEARSVEKSVDLELALINPDKYINKLIQDIAKKADSISVKIVNDIKKGIFHYAGLRGQVVKLANEKPELRTYLVPLLKKVQKKSFTSNENWFFADPPAKLDNLSYIIKKIDISSYVDSKAYRNKVVVDKKKTSTIIKYLKSKGLDVIEERKGAFRIIWR